MARAATKPTTNKMLPTAAATIATRREDADKLALQVLAGGCIHRNLVFWRGDLTVGARLRRALIAYQTCVMGTPEASPYDEINTQINDYLIVHTPQVLAGPSSRRD